MAIARLVEHHYIERHQKVIIAAESCQFLRRIEEVLKATCGDVTILHYNGDMKIPERQRVQDYVNNAPERCILLLSMKCGGVGLNLQGAHVMIIADHPWNP